MKKIIVAAVIVVVALGAAIYYYSTKPEAPIYKTAKVERGDLVSAVAATGNLAAVVTVQVGTQVSGTIQKLHVDPQCPGHPGKGQGRPGRR